MVFSPRMSRKTWSNVIVDGNMGIEITKEEYDKLYQANYAHSAIMPSGSDIIEKLSRHYEKLRLRGK